MFRATGAFWKQRRRGTRLMSRSAFFGPSWRIDPDSLRKIDWIRGPFRVGFDGEGRRERPDFLIFQKTDDSWSEHLGDSRGRLEKGESSAAVTSFVNRWVEPEKAEKPGPSVFVFKHLANLKCFWKGNCDA